MRLSVTFLLLIVVVAISGCKVKLNRSHGSDAEEASAKPAPTIAPVPVKSAAQPTVAIPPVARPIPAGPSFAVEAGAGLGPIRFGSTVATVERHMQTKCEELTDKYCRYVAAGIELELTKGAVSGIVIHRFDRPIAGDPNRKWGTFAGGIPPAVRMMMVPEAVIEYLGKPRRTEVVTGDNPNWTVRRDTYDGMILEYDKNRANDRLMLGQIRVVKK
jgi:hypothetical protein